MKPRVGQVWYYIFSFSCVPLLASSRGRSRPVSDLVDYSSCRHRFLFPQREVRLRRLRSSCNRAALLIRLTDLGDQTRFPSCTRRQSRSGRQILREAQTSFADHRATAMPAGCLTIVSGRQGSFRKSITQHRTSSLRATATIAFFLRVFCPPVSRS
jgi:hypothetical protein